MDQQETSHTPVQTGWRFGPNDAFGGLAPAHRATLAHALPGVIVWPILLFVLALATQSAALIGWNALIGTPDPAQTTNLLYTASALAYGFLAVLMWTRFSSYGASRPAFSIFPVRLSEIATGLAVLVFVILFGSRLSLAFHEFAMADPTLTLSGGAEFEDLSNVDDFVLAGGGMWSIVLLTIIAAPIVEEVLFRGWMLPMMIARGVPTIFAIAISSVAFGLIHINQGLLVIASTTILGAALGVARLVTGRVAAPVIGHMANNAWAVFAIPYLMGLQNT